MGDAGDERRLNQMLEDDNDFLCLRGLFRLSSRGFSVFLVLSSAGLRNFTSINELDSEGELDGEDGMDKF